MTLNAANANKMPMITLHWDWSGWYELHHGALRDAAAAEGWSDGRKPSLTCGAKLSPDDAEKLTRQAYPGVDVRAMNSPLTQNQFEMFDRRAAKRVTA